MKKTFTSFLVFSGLFAANTALNAQFTSLESLKSLYKAPGIVIPAGTTIAGVVISDTVNKNVSAGNYIFQSGNAGITLYLGSKATNTYSLWDSVQISVANDSLIIYQGAFEIKRNTTKNKTNPPPIQNNVVVIPRIVTLKELNDSIVPYESTLLTVLNASVGPQDSLYKSKITMTDATGSIILFTSTKATFATQKVPVGVGNFTGYAQNFKGTTPEFIIRNQNDVILLPLRLTSFTSSVINGQALLNWTAANETDFSHFEIEKSIDGKNFNRLENVNPSSSKKYSYLDASKTAGTAYYRLKIVDIDGKISYSKVVAVKGGVIQKLEIFPNPVYNNLTLSHSIASKGAFINIIGLDGKKEASFQIEEGATQSSFNVAHLAKATYTVVYQNNGNTTVAKIVKQ